MITLNNSSLRSAHISERAYTLHSRSNGMITKKKHNKPRTYINSLISIRCVCKPVRNAKLMKWIGNTSSGWIRKIDWISRCINYLMNRKNSTGKRIFFSIPFLHVNKVHCSEKWNNLVSICHISKHCSIRVNIEL